MMTKSEEDRLTKTYKKFKYRVNDNHRENFQRWWRWNTDEKKEMNLKPYTETEARLVWEETVFPNFDIEGTGADYEK